jgi:large subunit ribosomal protein L1
VKTRSKRYEEQAKKVEREKLYSLQEACKLIKGLPGAKFDEAVEMVLRLGIDAKKSDQLVRGTVALPHGTGKKVRVVVFAKDAAADEARAAGAEHVGYEDLIKKVSDGWTDFDIAVTTPDLMRDVGKLGRVLGPRGLMPSPKTGTVTKEIGKAVEELKAGKIEFRTDKGANVHVAIGKKSFSEDALVANAEAVIDALLRSKPASAKGTFLKKCTVTSTMGVGVSVAIDTYGSK